MVAVLFCYDSCRNRRRIECLYRQRKGEGRRTDVKRDLDPSETGILDERVHATILRAAIRCDSFRRGIPAVVVEVVGVKLVDSDPS